MTKVEPSLPQFERFVIERNHGPALLTAIAILEAVDNGYGEVSDAVVGERDASLSVDDVALAFCTRYAAAFGRMIADPNFGFSAIGYEALLLHHRWLDIIFSLSGFRGSDHLFPLIAGERSGSGWSFGGASLLRMLAVRSMNSRFDLDFDQLWGVNSSAAAIAFLHYMDSRYVFSSRGLQFRERLLEWLPDRIDDVMLGALTLHRIQEVYMHCSYAFTAKKHAIKAGLIRQMRRACLQAGCKELPPGGESLPKARPTVVVVIERFGRGHSVYRTHAAALRSLRERFDVVWVSDRNRIGTEFQDYYDELIPIPAGEFFAGVRTLADEIARRVPALVFHVGVGMSPQSIALASLRLAPIQCVSFGHTATTMSPVIDHMILPQDFIGDPACFSEKLIGLPRHAMPFMPHPDASVRALAPTSDDRPIRVAIAASTMKLNARLFETLARISSNAKVRVEFHFLPLVAIGLAHHELARTILRVLPGAVVHAQAPHVAYLESLRRCDLFLCPFPYGNMNSIVDAIGVGLPGVCLDGSEAHARADAALLAWAGLPAGLAAQTVEEYVAAAVRLIDDADWRAQCREIAVKCDLQRSFFQGDAGQFCQAIANLIWPGTEGKSLPPSELE